MTSTWFHTCTNPVFVGGLLCIVGARVRVSVRAFIFNLILKQRKSIEHK